jgi:transposase
MNGEIFEIYVNRILCPTLRPHDIVIMDNLGSHKGRIIGDAIAAKGARLRFLPPYSPDLNPIEGAFSKIKTALRKSACRSVHTICDGVNAALASFSSAHCAGFFTHAGYASM